MRPATLNLFSRQENRTVFVSKRKRVIYLNKAFVSKYFLVFVLPYIHNFHKANFNSIYKALKI